MCRMRAWSALQSSSAGRRPRQNFLPYQRRCASQRPSALPIPPSSVRREQQQAPAGRRRRWQSPHPSCLLPSPHLEDPTRLLPPPGRRDHVRPPVCAICAVRLCCCVLFHEFCDAGHVELFDYLVALKPEGAPDETIEQWNLRVGSEVPIAGKFFVQDTLSARKVRISSAPLPKPASTSAH
jgi:hypothetical protein